jgi:hypothetical protein
MGINFCSSTHWIKFSRLEARELGF